MLGGPTRWNPSEPVQICWDLLEPVGTRYNLLKHVTIRSDLLEHVSSRWIFYFLPQKIQLQLVEYEGNTKIKIKIIPPPPPSPFSLFFFFGGGRGGGREGEGGKPPPTPPGRGGGMKSPPPSGFYKNFFLSKSSNLQNLCNLPYRFLSVHCSKLLNLWKMFSTKFIVAYFKK